MEYENFWHDADDGSKFFLQQLCPDVKAMMIRTETSDGDVIDGVLSGRMYAVPFTVSGASPYKPRGMANNGVSIEKSKGGILVVNAGARASGLIENGDLDPVGHDYNAGLDTIDGATSGELGEIFSTFVRDKFNEASEKDFSELPPCQQKKAMLVGTNTYFGWSAVERGSDTLASYLERDAERLRAPAISAKAAHVAEFYRNLQSIAHEGCDVFRDILFKMSPELVADLEVVCDELRSRLPSYE